MIGDSEDPFTRLIAAADGTYALYEAYVRAGFAETAAVLLVSQLLASGVLDGDVEPQ